MTNLVLYIATLLMWASIGITVNVNLKKHTESAFRVQYNSMFVMLMLVLIERVLEAYAAM